MLLNPIGHEPAPQLTADEMAALVDNVEMRLSAALRLVESLKGHSVPEHSTGQITEQQVRKLSKIRASRARFIRGGLLADPAWDILLELYAASLGQRKVPVTALCAAANVPSTTALRWIAALEREGLISRIADQRDRRRSFMELTECGREAMTAFFGSNPSLCSL